MGNMPDSRGDRGGEMVQANRLDLYKLAYDEGKREVDNQIAQLDSMRQRSVQFLAFIGSASAFLVGTSLQSPVRAGWFYLIAVLASLLMLTSVYLCISLLRGKKKIEGKTQELWEFRLSANHLVGWIEADVRPTGPQFYRALADRYTKMADWNEKGLAGVRRRYRHFLWATLLQLILWLVLVWLYG